MILWRLLFLISAVIVIAAVLARGWYGKRLLTGHARTRCKTDAARWSKVFGETAKLPDGEDTAEAYGKAVRTAALERWQRDDPRSARSREATRRFGLIVPPLTFVGVILGIVVARIPAFGGVALVFVATALSVVFGLLSIGIELRIVAAALKDMRERHVFARREEEDAVAACAEAEVWMLALPPILRWI